MIVDTSALIAYFNSSEPSHEAFRSEIEAEVGPLIVSPYVVAETDYLVRTRAGVDAELEVLRELSGGAWDLADFGPEDLAKTARVVERYRDQDIGVADASQVVLADRHGTRRIATLDHRHFGVLRPIRGGRFSIVP